MPQFFGQLAQRQMPRAIFRIQQRHAFVARQRFDTALLLQEKRRCGVELFDRFVRVILLLQQRGVAQQPVGRLRVGPQKTTENRGGLRGIAYIEQPVELDPEILRGLLGFVQAGVKVGKALHGLAVRRRFIEDRLVFRHSLAELVFL